MPDPGAALLDRLRRDPALIGMMADLEGGAAWFQKWPADDLKADSFPRGTMLGSVEEPLRGDYVNGRYQVDIWVWPRGDDGGMGRLKAIWNAVRDLVHERVWTFEEGDQLRYRSELLPSTDFHGAPFTRLRRSMFVLCDSLEP